jgi:hypothetical protein
MAHLTYRVEITRDEQPSSGIASIEITAYIDRVSETDEPEFGRLSRAYKGVWNSRPNIPDISSRCPTRLWQSKLLTPRLNTSAATNGRSITNIRTKWLLESERYPK